MFSTGSVNLTLRSRKSVQITNLCKGDEVTKILVLNENLNQQETRTEIRHKSATAQFDHSRNKRIYLRRDGNGALFKKARIFYTVQK